MTILGACQKDVGLLEQARRTLAEARSLAHPDSWVHPRALFFEALTYVREGRWEAALNRLDNLIGRYTGFVCDPENEDLREEVNRYRAIALYEIGKTKEALRLLEQTAAVEYDKPRTLYYLGRCRYDSGDIEGAKQSLEEAIAAGLRPLYEPSAHYVLGLCHNGQQQHARAVREFEWCLQHDKAELVQRWKVLTALVTALKSLGQETEAERYSRILRQTSAS